MARLHKSMVRSHLDYCTSVWVPYKKGDIELLEKVQKRATKLIPTWHILNALKHKILTLHSILENRDMIKMYKILPGKYDTALTPQVNRFDTIAL